MAMKNNYPTYKLGKIRKTMMHDDHNIGDDHVETHGRASLPNALFPKYHNIKCKSLFFK